MQKLLTRDMIWKVGLALVGCVAVGVLSEFLGGALLWIAGGVILATTCLPLFRTLFERRGMKLGR